MANNVLGTNEKREPLRSNDLLCGGGLIHDITVCHLPYRDAPFVHGWMSTADGPRDVWLRNDGLWTTVEGDEHNSLMLSSGWTLPKD